MPTWLSHRDLQHGDMSVMSLSHDTVFAWSCQSLLSAKDHSWVLKAENWWCGEQGYTPNSSRILLLPSSSD